MSASFVSARFYAEDNLAAGPLLRYPPPRGLSLDIWTRAN